MISDIYTHAKLNMAVTAAKKGIMVSSIARTEVLLAS
jgi:hypothetical protein